MAGLLCALWGRCGKAHHSFPTEASAQSSGTEHGHSYGLLAHLELPFVSRDQTKEVPGRALLHSKGTAGVSGLTCLFKISY